MKKLIIPGALVGMAALIGVAMTVDCVRLANAARHRVDLADSELAKHEQRLVKTLKNLHERTPEVEQALDDYESAADRTARHAAFDKLAASVHQTISSRMDATNPTNRKFMDDVAGAINRRQIAEKEYAAEADDYRDFMNSTRGKAAQVFLSEK